MRHFVREKSAAADRSDRTDRIEALSDNIFAVAMTLLIVNIKVPQDHGIGSSAHVWLLVIPLWHHLRAFALSFLIIGLYWVAHHRIFMFIERSDAVLLLINLVFMGFTVLTPFLAGLLGQFDQSRVSLVLYGANMICISLSLQAAWWYATSQRRLVNPQLPQAVIRLNTARNLLVPAVCVFAIAASFVSPKVSLWIYLLAPLSFFWGRGGPQETAPSTPAGI